MEKAFLKILPATSPGLTAAEVLEGVLPHLPEDPFPQGATAGWWVKGVQLDLEAKGIVVREKPNHCVGTCNELLVLHLKSRLEAIHHGRIELTARAWAIRGIV